jgi:hypothetical protein
MASLARSPGASSVPTPAACGPSTTPRVLPSGSAGVATPSGVSGAIIPGVFGAAGVAEALGIGRLSITGVTMDSTGTPLPLCTIHVFLTADDTEVDQFDSNAVGVYAYYPTVAGPFYMVAYLVGAPDVAGTTVNTLVGT